MPRSYVSRSRLGNSAVETVEIRWPRCRVSRNVETAVAKIQRRKFRFGGRGSSRRAEKDGRGGERGESVDENPTRTREESAERKTSGVRPIETIVPDSRERVSNLRGGNLFLRVRRTTRVENRSMINRAKGMNIIVRTTNKWNSRALKFWISRRTGRELIENDRISTGTEKCRVNLLRTVVNYRRILFSFFLRIKLEQLFQSDIRKVYRD